MDVRGRATTLRGWLIEPLTLSVHDLLEAGGDPRLHTDPATGLSKYRVATRTRASVPLGSCTGSSPSALGIAAAGAVRDRLVGVSRRVEVAEELSQGHRQRLADLFELPDEVSLAFTPSGTDAIYLVSSLMLRDHARVHHVVVGASELGGGTVLAAKGLSIADAAPFGPATKGTPVEGLAERCSAEPIYLRDPDGALLEPRVADERVARAVEAVPADTAVVLHLVAHSKTGLRAPSTALCLELAERLGDRLLVLVDAAQGRVAPRDLRRSLELGFVVLFTGSKFYSGPPFSSVLLVPERWADGPAALALGLRDWFAKAEQPPAWVAARDSLPHAHNVGLMLRWEAALAEIEGYHATLPRHRAGVYHTFAGSVHEVFGPSQVIELDVPRPPVHELASALGAFPSVFSFRVRGPDGCLDADALRELHALLDTDLSAEHPELSGVFHLGQPVPLGPPGESREAVLRVALGARLVRTLAGHDDMGASSLRATLRALRAKLEGLVALGRIG